MARYEVIGTHRVFGHEPGTIFEASINRVQYERLKNGGHIRKVAASKTTTTTTESTDKK